MSEKNDVQLPFIKTLLELGYKSLFSIEEMFLMSDQELRDKSRKEQKKYRDKETSPLLNKVLKSKLLELNPFLTEELADEVIRDLKKLIDTQFLNNKKFHEYIVSNGYSIKIENKHETVRFIDFDNYKNNDFLVIPEFYISEHEGCYIDCQGFINGLPIFSKEDKSSGLIQKAMEEIALHYADIRNERRGCPSLFNYSMILIASDGEECLSGTTTGFPEHFSVWKDKDKKVNKSQQQTLAEAMLKPETLLDILRYFVLYGEKSIVLPKYSQYYSTKIIIDELLEGKRENSLIFKTQGSGKTFDMTFIVNYIRQNQKLSNNKLVFFLDRDNLTDNLLNTMKQFINNGEKVVKTVESGKELEELLKNEGSDVIVALIQKSRAFGKFKNKSKNIIVISDEAHRTNDGVLSATIKSSLPNAIYIGMTGTPIESTVYNFGKPKYAYTYKDSVEDGTTVPIIYKGVDVKINELTSKIDLEEIENFSRVPKKEREALYDKNINKKTMKSAPIRIEAISKFILNDCRIELINTPYKFMVRGDSREAAYLYYLELNKQLQLDPKLKHMKAKLVISKGSNKDVRPHAREMDKFTDSDYIYKTMYEEFKDVKNQEVKILVVADMGTTGYDVPCLLGVYNDKDISEDTPQSAFQWATRANRAFSFEDKEERRHKKEMCLFVDFTNILPVLNKAITTYSSKDLNGYEESIKDISVVKKELKLRYDELSNYVNIFDIERSTSTEIKKLKKLYNDFRTTFEFLLPDKSAMAYKDKFKKISKEISNILGHKNMTGEFAKFNITYGQKIKEIAYNNLYVENEGDVIINGLNLFSNEYIKQVSEVPKMEPKEKALTFTNTMRSHISKIKENDPVGAKKLSEKVDEVLKRLSGKWPEISVEMEELVKEIMNQTEEEKTFGIPVERRSYFNDYKEILLIFNEKMTMERVKEFNSFMNDLESLNENVADLSVNQSIRNEKVLELSQEFKDEFDKKSVDGEINEKSWKTCQKAVIVHLNHMLDNIIQR